MPSRPCCPPGCIFSLKDRYCIAQGLEKEAATASPTGPPSKKVLDLIYANGGQMEKGTLLEAFGTSGPQPGLRELLEQGVC